AALAVAALPLHAAAQTDTTAVTVKVAPASTDPPPAGDVPAAAIPRARRSVNSITYEEVRTARVADAETLIRNLRPAWLRTPRGANSMANNADIQIFMNGVRMGGREQLSTIPITAVRTLRYYTATEARQKFGGDTQAGVIEITSP
ncbi:MAG TPA: hypothetical protein VJT67_00510, partial [Longimicrobiaceae bacterium]|nr:hypothetical protein [Longimicrobiaceae bacterium]